MERAVGWFVILAMALLGFGFIYYVYTTAERKGWFKTKAPYFTFVESATGLKPGDPVMMMGFEAGRITEITPMPAEQFQYNVYVKFELISPNYDYIWSEGSRAKIQAADLLGKRVLAVTRGTGGHPTYTFHPLRQLSLEEAKGMPDLTNWALAEEILKPGTTNLLAEPPEPLTNLEVLVAAGHTNWLVMNRSEKRSSMTGIWDPKNHRFEPYTAETKPYWLAADESPPVTERLDSLVSNVQSALPNFLALTNSLERTLGNASTLASNLNLVVLEAKPTVTNLALATANLNRPGALGEWLLPTNINHQLETALGTANGTLDSVNTNLSGLIENLNRSLDNLAEITSNLNSQVAANTNLVKSLSDAIQHADQFVEGLKHHWLLRSAFKPKKTSTPKNPPTPALSPKAKGERQ